MNTTLTLMDLAGAIALLILGRAHGRNRDHPRRPARNSGVQAQQEQRAKGGEAEPGGQSNPRSRPGRVASRIGTARPIEARGPVPTTTR